MKLRFCFIPADLFIYDNIQYNELWLQYMPCSMLFSEVSRLKVTKKPTKEALTPISVSNE